MAGSNVSSGKRCEALAVCTAWGAAQLVNNYVDRVGANGDIRVISWRVAGDCELVLPGLHGAIPDLPLAPSDGGSGGRG
jgi:hypothetical protein